LAKLNVSRFSCIDAAEIEFSAMTVLIGPQASGKSVLSKLFYFFINQLHMFLRHAEDGRKPGEIPAIIAEEFVKWFPASAWGGKLFNIQFTLGVETITILRKRSSRGLSEKISVKLSDFFSLHYEMMFEDYQAIQKKLESRGDDGDLYANRVWEIGYKIKVSADRRLDKELGDDSFHYQLFIPAGRSFFTSIGKAVAAFEYAGILDPVTVRFGRLFASMRERARLVLSSNSEDADNTASTKLMLDLFGGHLRFVRDAEYVEASDGRKIPFSTLSSGQQELLPLWLTLRSFIASDREIFSKNTKPSPTLTYIEEPEAHLFPSAQGMLLEYLAGVVSKDRLRRKMLITTHSPYVLAKLNNLILAGQISRTRDKSKLASLEKIVPREAWLLKGRTSAYAIIDRKVQSIIDDDGLIDGEYLDGVSSDISNDFLSMLELKYGGNNEKMSDK
jgi:hypothetical protein